MRHVVVLSAVCAALITTGCSGSPTTGGSSGSASSATTGRSSSTGSLTTGGSNAGASTGSTGTTSTGTTSSGTATTTSAGSSTGGSGSTGTNPLITARPYLSIAPTGFDPSVKLPLVVMLHGYSSNARQEESYLALRTLVDSKHFFYAAPDGTVEASANANRFWNATDACCNFYGSTVDDVAYLTAVIDDMSARYPVDPKRVFFIGHSNGGFMTHRMACERAGRIAAVLSLAGAQNNDATKCSPTEPVSVVELHGDADQTIQYGGGLINGVPYPSALTTITDWATKDGCSTTAADAGNLDLVGNVPGNETNIQRFAGCPTGNVELWTIQGGGHIPYTWSSTFAPTVIDWLFAHPKP